ncbi:YjcQ family protein [Natranaerobius thermophilus]|uniref:YjcQ protein n=1 Tax=Natranaerobius thermophilus (strain ATCC BAA-1301 / DSM 18059 / JW/NM-WN-LF) TaxID=457570 RepID=B2A5C4_NATTJ|nr:YjcQ family protein [Natranaerobius thermophilus]ACB83958.1 hypothetical protein Nther_0361 [Natranaerobius thermophilus JW/NM-WN-LF]
MSAKETMDIIFQILERLEKAMDEEQFNWEKEISHEALDISETRWTLIIEMMEENNLIKGLNIDRGAKGDISISIHSPRIRLQGLNFLIENSQTAKVINAAKLLKDTVPGL